MIDLSRMILIDQHAHSLLADFSTLDAIGFRQAFSESSSMAMLQDHVQHCLHYRHMLKQLGEFLDVRGEKAILEMRSSLGALDYAQMLFDAASIGKFIIDNGFNREAMLNLSQLSQLSGRPVYKCARIETVLEDCLRTADSFAHLRELFALGLGDQSDGRSGSRSESRSGATLDAKLVSLKTIAAYRGGIDLDTVSLSEAKDDFSAAQKQARQEKRFRIGRRPLYHFFLAQAFEIAQERSLPVQIHTGIGDRDADLRLSDPSYFRAILEAKTFAKTNFVFLHCYPFVRQAAILASLYANVYFDLSLAVTLDSAQAVNLFADALSIAPFTKILMGTDGHSVPETYWYASSSMRTGLSGALSLLIAQRFLDEEEAMDIAAHLFHKNAQTLYQFDDDN